MTIKICEYTKKLMRDLGLPENISIIKQDLTGLKIKNYKIIKKTRKTDKNVFWLCRCVCGKFHEMNSYFLLGTRNKNNRCKRCSFVGDISLYYYKKYIKCAKERNIVFNISHKYLWELFLKQERLCALSGLELFFNEDGRGPQTASLDRIDSSKGYIEGNVQWIYRDINIMKNSISEHKFIKLCKLIARGPKS